MINIASRFDNMNTKNYFMDQNQIKNITFKSDNSEENIPKTKRRDIFAEMPIRVLGYSNELGEAIRPLSPLIANISWLPAIGYISADITDKYKQDEYSTQTPSKSRAGKQLITQLLSSVFLPTAAVKIGQTAIDKAAKMSDTGLSLSAREKVSDIIINSMKAGEHKKFLGENGLIDKVAYKESLYDKFDEILKNRRTQKDSNVVSKIVSAISKPFTKNPTGKKVKNYTSMVIDRLIDERQQLLDGIKPENLSQKGFKKFLKAVKNTNPEETQSIAFNTIRKMERGRMFNNRILKSIGGLIALSLLAKPIDNFVENVIIERYVSPAIDTFKTYNNKYLISNNK